MQLQVQIPPGAYPGYNMQVQLSNGQMISVQVPPGAFPGSTVAFQINMPQPQQHRAPEPPVMQRQQEAPRRQDFEMLELTDRSADVNAPRRNLKQRGRQQSTAFRSSAPERAAASSSAAANLGYFCCLTTRWLQAAERTAPQLCAALLCCRAPLGLYCLPCYSRRLLVVDEDEVGIVERFNKFDRVVAPGPILLEQPLGIAVETLRRRVSLRTRRVVVDCESKTKDNVFCRLELLVSYRLRGQDAFFAARDGGGDAAAADAGETGATSDAELSAGTSRRNGAARGHRVRPADYAAAFAQLGDAAQEATYKIEDFEGLVKTVASDVVRAFLATVSLDRAFLASDEVATAVHARLARDVAEFGYECRGVLLVRFAPAQSVANEMNDIYTQALKRQSQEQVALARKDVQYILSTADAARKHLRGQGVSLMRRAYLSGMQECLDAFVGAFSGARGGDYVLSWADVLYMQLLLQHFDAQRAMHASGTSSGGAGGGQGGAGTLALNLGPQAVYALRDRLSVGHVRKRGAAAANSPASPRKPPPRPKVKAVEKKASPKTSPRGNSAASAANASPDASAGSSSSSRGSSKERKEGAPPRAAGGKLPPPARRPPPASGNRPATAAASRDASQDSVASRGSRASRKSAGSL